MKAETNASSFSVKTLATIILVVALLYWAKEVFIPFALAVLFSFVLGPIVTRLRRLGLGRVTGSFDRNGSDFRLHVLFRMGGDPSTAASR